MRKGFIFSYELCVGCKACSAACMLENGWSFRSRNVYSSNSACFTPDPVINLSMACNHCGDPVCLKGCPSGAYSKDNASGAVIIDPDKCVGCRYCIWNCPYDAPKFNDTTGIIEKCHFCFHRIGEGVEPACSSSCPTGALSFGEIPETISLEKYSWIPDKKINPSLLITGSERYDGPGIIPSGPVSVNARLAPLNHKKAAEWSLVGFTFLTTLSVALSIAGLFTDRIINGTTEIVLILLAGFFSLFHVGSMLKAWRAVVNFKSSPLSREIAFFLIYAALIILNQITRIPYPEVIISVAGISLVLMIDSVYNFAEGRGTFRLHSGQAFLTGMVIVSFLLNAVLPFVFIGVVKSWLSVSKILTEERKEMFILRFIRLAFLIITVMVLILGTDSRAPATFVIFFSGELADRVIFYADFKPLNIKDTLK